MEDWICESCIYYPPSACDGKPCTMCDTSDPLTSCYEERKDVTAMQINHTKED